VATGGIFWLSTEMKLDRRILAKAAAAASVILLLWRPNAFLRLRQMKKTDALS